MCGISFKLYRKTILVSGRKLYSTLTHINFDFLSTNKNEWWLDLRIVGLIVS